jgi:hypothetical protein
MTNDLNGIDENLDASRAPLASHDDAAPLNDAVETAADSGAGDASVASPAPVAALANDLTYTMTVGQARELFAHRGRKVPAERTLQNYCVERQIASEKIRTSYGSEWLINEASLLAFIERQPIIATAPAATPAPHEDATPRKDTPATTADSDAGDAAAAHAAAPIGERRTLADVLIENAKLLATIEGKDQVIAGKDETIAELKDDRGFLRDEVREARQQRKDVKDIASRMLDAMQNIAIAGKLPPARSSADDITARVIHPDDLDVDRQRS